MKIDTVLLLACAAQATSADHLHVRVHQRSAPGAWQPCTESIGCTNSVCVRQSPEYAQCMPPLKEGELCGRYVADRPEEASQNWKAACVSGLDCVLKDGKDMRCVKAGEVPTTTAPTTPSPPKTTPAPTSPPSPPKTTAAPTPCPSGDASKGDDDEAVGVWEQCAAQDWEVDCEDDNVCVYQSEWYSQCMPAQLDAGALCGQNGEQVWQHDCKTGLTCVQKDGKDMRCVVAKAKKSHNKKHAKQTADEASADGVASKDDGSYSNSYDDEEFAGVGEPCIEGEVDCEGENVCVMQSDTNGVCMPPTLAEGELCGQNGDQVWQHDCDEGLTCKQTDGKDMRCTTTKKAKKAKKAKTAHKKKLHHGKPHKGQAQVWQQCGGQGWTATCVGSTCVKQSEWYSQCMPHKLDAGALCGQNGDQKWQHACKAGLKCVQKDGKDMRCVEN